MTLSLPQCRFISGFTIFPSVIYISFVFILFPSLPICHFSLPFILILSFFFASGAPEEEGLGQDLMLTLWVRKPWPLHTTTHGWWAKNEETTSTAMQCTTAQQNADVVMTFCFASAAQRWWFCSVDTMETLCCYTDIKMNVHQSVLLRDTWPLISFL